MESHFVLIYITFKLSKVDSPSGLARLQVFNFNECAQEKKRLLVSFTATDKKLSEKSESHKFVKSTSEFALKFTDYGNLNST